MTDRERWTVYPLLFLALGIAVKDKLVKRVSIDDIRCSRLAVTDRGGSERVVLAANPVGGAVQLQCDLINVESVRCGKLSVIDSAGRDRVVLASNAAGGVVQIQGDKNVRDIVLGFSEYLAGLIFVDDHGQWKSPIAVPINKPDKPSTSPPEKKPDPAGEQSPAPRPLGPTDQGK